MASLFQAKALGEVGSILILLGLIPNIGLFIAIAGLVLILIAVKYISELLEDPSVFKNMLIAVVLFIGGVSAAEAIFLTGIFSLFGTVSSMSFTGFPPFFVEFLVIVIIAGAFLEIFIVVGAIFLRKSYKVIGTRLGTEWFCSTGLVFLIGGGLIIAFGIGLPVLGLAAIMQIVAFFSLPDQLPTVSPEHTWSLPPSSDSPNSMFLPQTLSYKTLRASVLRPIRCRRCRSGTASPFQNAAPSQTAQCS
jgi:uncharacterized membrane protein